MHRPRKEPSYRLHKPTGQAVVTLDGRDRYLGKHGSPESLELYHRLIAEWHKAKDAAPTTPAQVGGPRPDPTVNEVILAYWQHTEGRFGGRADRGQELDYIRYALRAVRKAYGSTPAREFGPLKLKAIRAEMLRSGLARSTANSRVNRIRVAFKWAVSEELYPAESHKALMAVAPLEKGEAGARETAAVAPVPVERVEATLPFLSGPVAALVRIQLLTGCRPGEAMQMRGCDLTPGETTWTYRPGAHKNAWRGKSRIICLGPKAIEIVKAALKPDLNAYLFAPSDAVAAHHARRAAARKSRSTPSEKAKLAKGGPGRNHAARYNRRSYLSAVVRACDKAFPHPTLGAIKTSKLSKSEAVELKEWRRANRWSPLQLRHTAATAIRARFDRETATAILGHSDPGVTERYALVDVERARATMAEIG